MSKNKYAVIAAVTLVGISLFFMFYMFTVSRRTSQTKLNDLQGLEVNLVPSALQKPEYHISPFTGVRWVGSTPEIELKATWYGLVSLNSVPANEIVSFCKKTYGKVWRKRFEEDLVMVLKEMGKGGSFDTAALEVRQLDSGKTVALRDIPWTMENRDRILRKAVTITKANGGKDPRDDPNSP